MSRVQQLNFSVNAKEEILRVSHRLLIDLPPIIHTFKPGGTVTVRLGSKVNTVSYLPQLKLFPEIFLF
jgi:hypothetical protein